MRSSDEQLDEKSVVHDPQANSVIWREGGGGRLVNLCMRVWFICDSV
uniref:Uncharacterized protein n=1 Tax=Arundo donax TaxID=35708 RepID=A0A0A9GFR5_ARUDO